MADYGIQSASGVPRRRISRQYVSLAGPLALNVPEAPDIPHPIYPNFIFKKEAARWAYEGTMAFPQPIPTWFKPEYPNWIDRKLQTRLGSYTDPNVEAAAPWFKPIYPDTIDRKFMARLGYNTDPDSVDTVPPTFFDAEYPDYLFRLQVHASRQQDFVMDLDEAAPAAPDFYGGSYPDRIFRTYLPPGGYPPLAYWPFPLPDISAVMPTQPPLATLMEGSSGVYRATLRDELGNLLVPTTLNLSMYVIGAGGIATFINSRREQPVLNAFGVTVYPTLQTDTFRDGSTVQYNLKWIISPDDTVILYDQLQLEKHVCLFEWTYGSGQAGKREFVLGIRNLGEVI